jgi:hypothetical protein
LYIVTAHATVTAKTRLLKTQNVADGKRPARSIEIEKEPPTSS